MVKTIICSVGTSAAKKLGIHPEKLEEWVQQQRSIDLAAEMMFQTFQEFEAEGTNLTAHLSAEIHSLVRIGIEERDRILLLASETLEGQCCAIAVGKYLQHYWPRTEVRVIPISGLQVKDAKRFRNEGVVNFVKQTISAIDDYGNVILNPTGGYKALVPYTVLVGMLKGAKCDYIFERSTTLLELPPLPVEFKRSQFEAYKGLFETIDRETAISQAEWEEQVSYEERAWFDSLVEQSNGEVTLSAIGFLFLDEIRRPSALVPFLSQKAIKDCFENLVQLEQCDPFRFLERVATSREVFKQSDHISADHGLHWLKPGNTKDRYLVSIEGWRMLVWRAIRKDQEGDNYPNTIRINPEIDRRSYSPFMRMDFVN